jgi:hypothetical protein
LEGLHGLGIVKFIEDKDLVYWKGEPLLNGAFGVPKGDLTAPDFSVDTCVLRFIVNLQPSNDIQHVIRGDIERLPLFSQWLQLELLEHECFLLSADDQASAFNLYSSRTRGCPTSCLVSLRSRRRSSASEFLPGGAGRQ